MAWWYVSVFTIGFYISNVQLAVAASVVVHSYVDIAKL